MSAKVVQKQVRFYEAVLLDQHEDLVPMDTDFWASLRGHVKNLQPADRVATYRGSRYAGVVRTAMAPAYDYVLFGHVRDRADWPGTFDESKADFGVLRVQ